MLGRVGVIVPLFIRIQRRAVVGVVGVQRAEDAQVVDALGELRQQLADRQAALAAGLERERHRHAGRRSAFSVRNSTSAGRWPANLLSAGLGSKKSA